MQDEELKDRLKFGSFPQNLGLSHEIRALSKADSAEDRKSNVKSSFNHVSTECNLFQ